MFSFFFWTHRLLEKGEIMRREKENTLQTVAKKEEKKKHTTINQTHEDFAKKKSSLFVNVSCFYVSYFFRTFFSYTLNATRTKKGKSRTMGEREWNVLKMNSYETIFIDTPTHFGIIIFCFLFEKKTWTC